MADTFSLPMAEIADCLARASSRRVLLPKRRSPITSVSAPSSWHIRNGLPSMRENAPMPLMLPLPLVRERVLCKAFRPRSKICLPSRDLRPMRLAQTLAAEIRDRWPGRRQSAPAIGDRHG